MSYFREQVMWALVKAHWRATVPDRAPAGIILTEEQKLGWQAVADECIRQMEFVRSECADLVGGAAEDTHEAITDLKLTAAPDDWSPK